MGFKIRDKSLFWTKSGWKNNWEPKIVNMPRAISPKDTAFLINRSDHHSYLRMWQSYRNYSRICRQFFYGNKQLEQALTLQLRAAFKIPLECETPVEIIKHGAQRRFADQLDRDYQLMTHNYHPFQLQTYQLSNQRLRQENEEVQRKQNGEQTFPEALEEAFEHQIAEEQKKIAPGEKLSLQKLTDIFHRVSNAAREQMGQTKARGDDGEFNDFLEKRRPFTEADNERVSN